MSSMDSIFSWVYTRFSPNVVLAFSSLSSVVFCFPHPILSLCTPHHSPPRNTGFFCLRRFPIVSLRRGEIKGIQLVATWFIPYMCFLRHQIFGALSEISKIRTRIYTTVFFFFFFPKPGEISCLALFAIFCPVKDESVLMSFCGQM